tara:strand:+ start:253 stop:507 length:255 start_codon:yes stop_codon:yes gene_type:complete
MSKTIFENWLENDDKLWAVCPLTNKIMIDPVIASDGHSYEKKALEEWLSDKKTSPITDEELKKVFLGEYMISNKSLKNIISYIK